VHSILAALLVAASSASADPALDPQAMLARGPLVTVERGLDGRFLRCKVLVHIRAPPARVWAAMTDFPRMKEFIPRLLKSDVLRTDGSTTDVAFEMDTPGTNSRYVLRHLAHPDSLELDISWVSGDLRGASWHYRVAPAADGGTLLLYSGNAGHFSSVIESLEDGQQTLTLGINVGAALSTVNALQAHVEQAAKSPGAVGLATP
jgi:hypothetical protein